MPKEKSDALAPATHALAVPGWGFAPGFRGMAIGGQTLVLLAGEPEPLENFLSLEAAKELFRAGRITWCDEKGNPAAAPAGAEGALAPPTSAPEDEDLPPRG